MGIYAIGDPHLSFAENVDKPMDVFGEEWKDHAEKIKESWLALVGPEDTVVVAGDISWGLKFEEALPDLQWIHNLPGKKVMLKGNHDLWWAGIGKLNSLFEDMIFLQNTCVETEEGIICGSRGWVCPGSDDFTEGDKRVYDREVLRLEFSLQAGAKAGKNGKEIIAFTHYPPTNEKKQPSDFTRLFEEYGVKNAYYGHLHRENTFKRGLTGNLNGVNYELISADKLKFELKKIK